MDNYTQPPEIRVLELLRNTEFSKEQVILQGRIGQVANFASDIEITVACGKGIVESDFAVHDLSPGSTIQITKGTPYHIEGSLKMVVTSWPPFSPDSVEYLD